MNNTYKIISTLCVVLLYSTFCFGQDLQGTWTIHRIERIFEDEVFVDFDRYSTENIMDVSKIEITYHSGGNYVGKNVYGDLVDGTWSTDQDLITHDHKTSTIEIIDDNNFKTIKAFRFFDIDGNRQVSMLHTYYTKNVLLPIFLSEFKVETDKSSSYLSWATGIEETFSYFEVEKSMDRQTFYRVGQVNATGSNSVYNFEDQEAFAQATTVFYRLKMVDHDDSFYYSQVKTISTTQEEVDIFPNPTRSIVNYKQPPNTATTYKVLSLEGKLLSSGNVQDSGTIDLASLPKGAYHLVFLKGKKAIHYDRVLKL